MCRAEHSAVLREVQIKTASRCYLEPLKGDTEGLKAPGLGKGAVTVAL